VGREGQRGLSCLIDTLVEEKGASILAKTGFEVDLPSLSLCFLNAIWECYFVFCFVLHRARYLLLLALFICLGRNGMRDGVF
jgi:hypothetical protein